MITRDAIRELFENSRRLHDEGHATFDIDQCCRWSYFFIDQDRTKLTHLGLALEEKGYEVIGILEPSPGEDDQVTAYLRADRVETHTVDSLHERNHELYGLADRFEVADYDGMDVGGIDAP